MSDRLRERLAEARAAGWRQGASLMAGLGVDPGSGAAAVEEWAEKAGIEIIDMSGERAMSGAFLIPDHRRGTLRLLLGRMGRAELEKIERVGVKAVPEGMEREFGVGHELGHVRFYRKEEGRWVRGVRPGPVEEAFCDGYGLAVCGVGEEALAALESDRVVSAAEAATVRKVRD